MGADRRVRDDAIRREGTSLLGQLGGVEADEQRQIQGRPVSHDLRVGIHGVGELLRPAERQVFNRDELPLPVPKREHEAVTLLRTGHSRVVGPGGDAVHEGEAQPQPEGCLQYDATSVGH